MGEETVERRWWHVSAIVVLMTFAATTLYLASAIGATPSLIGTGILTKGESSVSHTNIQAPAPSGGNDVDTDSGTDEAADGGVDVTTLDRVVVVAHYHENLTWAENYTIPIKLVEKDNASNPDSMNSNNFTEATSYLFYMIKYYDELPDVMAFVHGHGDDMVLKDSVWRVHQYQALPRLETKVTCNTQQKDEGGFLVWLGTLEDLPPFPPELAATQKGDHYHEAFHDLFDFLRLEVEKGGMGMELPHYIQTLCCSAFTVDRDTIRRIPKDRLVRLFNFLEASHNRDMGVTMEYVWMALFNQKDWS